MQDIVYKLVPDLQDSKSHTFNVIIVVYNSNSL
jgi:hypothetical protein